MRVVLGQLWELASSTDPDPCVLKVVQELADDRVSLVMFRRSNPATILSRHEMLARDLMDMGVLVEGPGSLHARRLRERIAYLSELLLYAARKHGCASGSDVRFDGREVVAMVAADEKCTPLEARAMLRQALAALGGTERTTWHDARDIVYVLPVSCLRRAA